MENVKSKGRLRGIVAALVALALVAVCVPAVAALALPEDPPENDSLPPSTGSLTIHKYAAEDMSKIGGANDGTEVTVDGSFTALSGVTFNIYKVAANANGDYPSKAPYRLSGTTLTDADNASFTVSAASTSSVTTGTDGKATASNLAQGVYLVVERPSDKVAEPADNFVVAVPMTNTAGNGWISDVHVYPKNQVMYVNKFLTVGSDNAGNKTQNGSAVNVGDTVHYSIVPTVPTGVVAYSTNADGTPVTPATTSNLLAEDSNISYAVTDTLDEALTFVQSSVKVYGLSASDDPATGGTSITSGYNVTLEANNTAKIDFTQAGRIALYNAGYTRLRVELDATVNSKVLEKTATKIENTGYVNFTNKFGQEKTKKSTDGFNPDVPTGPDPDPDNPDNPNPDPVVHTAHISITKKDASNTNTTLSGAKFKIADTKANAEAGNYLRKTTDGAVVDPSDSRWATATDWEETSAATTGVVTFDGIEDYTSTIQKANDGTYTETKTYCSYWLVETQAPEGYNLPAAPFEIAFTATDSTAAKNWTVYKDITNTNEFTLPLTGGMGTVLLTLAGVVLIGGAAVAFVAASRKKKGAHEQR